MAHDHLLSATRKALNVSLKIKEGDIPQNLSGYVYINSGAGNVNSDGLPYPKKNPDGSWNKDFGSPAINGDGYVFRLDCTTPGKVNLKTDVLKPPCYFADVATSPVVRGEDNPYVRYQFKNSGLARTSHKLGTRNQLNTAFQPFRVPGDEQLRMLATFDAGRPHEFDPEKIEIITAIGDNKFWKGGTPPMLHYAFPMVLNTAHPVYDPDTKELFSVNFTKTTSALLSATDIFHILFHDEEALERKLENKVKEWEQREDQHEVVKETEHFFKHVKAEVKVEKEYSWWEKLKLLFWRLIGRHFSNKNEVYLISWKGEKKPQKWKVVDEKGKGIEIMHNMHQIGFSKDYVILGDTNFKFTLDVMLNNPFPHNERIDAFLRKLLSGAMLDYSSLYIVKRSDLKPGKKKVYAQKVTIPAETVHFSVNYDNPDDLVTVHTAHNCSACPAEWLRYYDTLKAKGSTQVDEQRVGLLSVGEMDVGKIGKIVVDAKNGTLVNDKTVFLHECGNPGDPNPAPHTWAVGLYTYDGMLSPDANVKEIKHIFWQAYGLSDEMLTDYIYDLYGESQRTRIYSPDEVEEFTKKGSPFVLERVDTDTMKITDHYAFPKDFFMWSLQFVPSRDKNPEIPSSLDGYVLCTVIGPDEVQTEKYNSEIWIFDANNLQKGPLCKLYHEELVFAFTIHSVWVNESKEVSQPPYKLDVKKDYDAVIKKIPSWRTRKDIKKLMNEEVYPNFA